MAGVLPLAAGCLLLAGYGLLVNVVRRDFSRVLGTYGVVFAVVRVLCGRFLFRHNVPVTTWLGLALVIAGGRAPTPSLPRGRGG